MVGLPSVGGLKGCKKERLDDRNTGILYHKCVINNRLLVQSVSIEKYYKKSKFGQKTENFYNQTKKFFLKNPNYRSRGMG